MFLRFLVLAIAVTAPAAAQNAPQAQPQAQPQSGYDPNEKICETITLTGSRLSKKRFCATRAEWAEMRLRDRQEIDKAQRSPCVIQSTTSRGHASC